MVLGYGYGYQFCYLGTGTDTGTTSLTSSTLLGAASPSLIWGIGHRLLFDAPELSSGLSLEQMVGFSLVHSLLGFLGCESCVRLN